MIETHKHSKSQPRLEVVGYSAVESSPLAELGGPDTDAAAVTQFSHVQGQRLICRRNDSSTWSGASNNSKQSGGVQDEGQFRSDVNQRGDDRR
jgi:hypothetical protein